MTRGIASIACVHSVYLGPNLLWTQKAYLWFDNLHFKVSKEQLFFILRRALERVAEMDRVIFICRHSFLKCNFKLVLTRYMSFFHNVCFDGFRHEPFSCLHSMRIVSILNYCRLLKRELDTIWFPHHLCVKTVTSRIVPFLSKR